MGGRAADENLHPHYGFGLNSGPRANSGRRGAPHCQRSADTGRNLIANPIYRERRVRGIRKISGVPNTENFRRSARFGPLSSMFWPLKKPATWRGYRATIQTVARCGLLGRHGLGGSRWVRHFVYGPLLPDIFRNQVCTRRGLSAPSPSTRRKSGRRHRAVYVTRARLRGRRAHVLWTSALDQVGKGWAGPPLKIDPVGKFATFGGAKSAAIAFRISVDQSDKIRARDDRKYLVGKSLLYGFGPR